MSALGRLDQFSPHPAVNMRTCLLTVRRWVEFLVLKTIVLINGRGEVVCMYFQTVFSKSNSTYQIAYIY